MSGAEVKGKIDVNERTVLGILDEEAKRAVGAATRLRRNAVNAAAPRGATGRLARSHRLSVKRTPFGYAGGLKRTNDAWYGRIVETGRKAGRSERTGRRYPAAKANPFVDRATAAVERQAEETLDAGADRAAKRIESRL